MKLNFQFGVRLKDKVSPVLGIISSKFTSKGPEPDFMIPPDLDPSISTTISIKAISTMAGESDEAKEAISVLPFTNIKANGLVYFYRITDATARGGAVFASLTILIHEIDSSFLYHNIAKLKDLLGQKGQQIKDGNPSDIVCTELYDEINEIAKYESSSRQILLEYGLDTEETDAYFYMVHRGPVGIGEISILLQIDREKTLSIMEKLNEKGLINTIPGKKLIYQALPPYRALLNQLNTFIPFIQTVKNSVPNSTDDLTELNDKYLSSLNELEKQIKKTLITMEALFKSTQSKITFKFKNLWFIDGAEAIIAEITDIIWKAKIRIYLVTPTIEDVNLSIIKNIPKKVQLRIATYIDINNENHLRIALELSNEQNISFRQYKKQNLWGINRDQEEIIIGIVSKDRDIAAVASDVKEQIQMFAPILETAWINGIPLSLTNLTNKPTTSPFEEIEKTEFEKIETTKLITAPKETPKIEIKHKAGYDTQKTSKKQPLEQKNIFLGMSNGFQKIEPDSTKKVQKKKKIRDTEKNESN